MLRPSLRRLTTASWFQTAVGVVGAEYLRLIWKTSRFALGAARHLRKRQAGPAGHRRDVARPAFPHAVHQAQDAPGQDADLASSRRRVQRGRGRMARHRGDPRLRHARPRISTARAARPRSGKCSRRSRRATTSRSPPTFPRCRGSAASASSSSPACRAAPIYPLAIATSPRRVLNNWDRSVVHFPFGRGARVAGTPVRVPPDADDATLEAARHAVEASLNAATARAYEIVDGTTRRRRRWLNDCRRRCAPIGC